MKRDSINKCVGKQLNLQRIRMGLSQATLGAAANVTYQQIQKYEQGESALSSTRLYEFSQFMGVPISYFFEGLEKNSANNNEPSAEDKTIKEPSQSKLISQRERLEVMKIYNQIKDPSVRKRVTDLIRFIAAT